MAQVIDDSKVPSGAMSACIGRIHERGDYWRASHCPHVRICVVKKKGADTGIDGYLYFMDEKNK
jgi:hypothetical protein